MDYIKLLDRFEEKGKLPPSIALMLRKFFVSYTHAVNTNGYSIEQLTPLLKKYLTFVVKQLAKPHKFEAYHRRSVSRFNYYQFGIDLIRPLIVLSESKVLGEENIQKIEQQLNRHENVILLANHQTEPDPQAISVLLEKTHPNLAEEMIFVAGHRVITDPLAAPLSKGRNLLCIFSKKYIETPPEHKQEELLHNHRTMKKMSQLLSEGGKCIYVAPSGGRDRPNAQGIVEVDKFDPQSIEMFWLMAQQSGHPTHFYPLTLSTYDLLPPPNSIEIEIGERRCAQCTPIHMAFGAEVDMENFPGSQSISDKKEKRKVRADYIWGIVCRDYQKLKNKTH